MDSASLLSLMASPRRCRSSKKKPYKELTLDEKIELIRLAESNAQLSQAAIAERYAIAKSNVCRILQRKAEYLRAHESARFSGSRKRKLRSEATETYNETLRDHMRKQHQIRPFMCRCCNWAFPDKTSLHMHMQGQQEGKTVNVPVVGKGNPPMGADSPSTPPFPSTFTPNTATTPTFSPLNPVAAAMAMALNQNAAAPTTPIQPTPLFPAFPQLSPLFPHLSNIQPDNTDLLSKIGGRLFLSQLWRNAVAAQSEDAAELRMPNQTAAATAEPIADFPDLHNHSKPKDNNNTQMADKNDDNNNNDQTRSHNNSEPADEEQSPTNTQTSTSPADAHYDFPKNSTPTLQENCRCGFGDEVRQLRIHNEYLMQKLVECRERIVVSLRSDDARGDLLHDLLKITFMD